MTMESALQAATDTDSVFDAWWENFGRFQLDPAFACKMAFLHGQAFGQEIAGQAALRAFARSRQEQFEPNPHREELVK